MTTIDSGTSLSPTLLSSTANAAIIQTTISSANIIAPSETKKSTAITIPINSLNKNSDCDYNVSDCYNKNDIQQIGTFSSSISLSCQQQTEQPQKFYHPPQINPIAEMSVKRSSIDTHSDLSSSCNVCHVVQCNSVAADDLPQSSAASFSSCCSSCSLNSGTIVNQVNAHINSVIAEDVQQGPTTAMIADNNVNNDNNNNDGDDDDGEPTPAANNSTHVAALPLITPQKSRTIPADKINLRVILVSGKTKEFLFNPTDSAADIVQTVFLNWPDDWKHEAVSKAEILRLIFQGRFLHCSVTLGALGLPLGKTTVMHLVSRDNLPEPNSPDQGQKGKSGSNRCCSAACCIL